MASPVSTASGRHDVAEDGRRRQQRAQRRGMGSVEHDAGQPPAVKRGELSIL
jgi:hypothetical protein